MLSVNLKQSQVGNHLFQGPQLAKQNQERLMDNFTFKNRGMIIRLFKVKMLKYKGSREATCVRSLSQINKLILSTKRCHHVRNFFVKVVAVLLAASQVLYCKAVVDLLVLLLSPSLL